MPDAQAANPPPASAAAPASPPTALPVEVPMLDASAWREYRGQPGKATANSTHIALVADDAGVERICFVKLAPSLDKPTLLCEALGWVLAGHAGLRRSEFGAIILVDKARLAKSQQLTAECAAFQGDFIPAWCSEAIPGNSVLSHAKSPSKPGMQFIVEHKTFLNSKDARAFAAFDQWTGLRDRNMGNVIRHKAGGYASIDHETMLHDIIWVSSNFNHSCLVKHAEKALDGKRAKAFKADMTRAAAGHAGALASAKLELQALLDMLLPGAIAEHAAAMSFLADRAQRGWLAGELGVLDMAAKED
ncbi:MAG: hypothetical protein QM702_12045 [Rubrivivax sp.]